MPSELHYWVQLKIAVVEIQCHKFCFSFLSLSVDNILKTLLSYGTQDLISQVNTNLWNPTILKVASSARAGIDGGKSLKFGSDKNVTFYIFNLILWL